MKLFKKGYMISNDFKNENGKFAIITTNNDNKNSDKYKRTPKISSFFL